MMVILTRNVVNSVACIVTHNGNLMAVEQSYLSCIFVSLVSSDRMLCTVADIQLGMLQEYM